MGRDPNHVNKWTKEYRKEQKLLWDRKQRAKLMDIMGNKCVICGLEQGGTQYLHLHEINGVIHPLDKGKYVLAHKDDFVPLCKKCHNFIHTFARCKGDMAILTDLCNRLR